MKIVIQVIPDEDTYYELEVELGFVDRGGFESWVRGRVSIPESQMFRYEQVKGDRDD